jgi:dolichol-phosphate mannosyltransferase
MIYFLIPIFNEEDNIRNLFGELSAFQSQDEIFYVFSDDGSTDNSQKQIEHYFQGRNFCVLGDKVNRGPGAAFNTGFLWVLNHAKNDNDLIVTMEADCTSDLSILPTMITLNSLGFDLVLASVYAQGGGFDKTTFFRKFASALANFIYRFIFDVKVLTLSSFYRVYTIALIKKIQVQYKGKIIEETGFVSMLEILIKGIWCNAKIIEVPMQLHSHKRIGRSKMKVLKTTFQYLGYLIKAKRAQPKIIAQ